MTGRSVRPLVAISAVAALGAAHLLGVALSLGSPERLRLVHDLAGWAGSLFGVAGTVAAATAFARGDWLRRVWTLFAVGAVLLLVGTAMRSHWVHVAPERSFLESPLLPWRMLVIIAANAVTVAAMVSLTLTYRRSGLSPPLTPVAALLWALSSAAALAIAVPQFVVDFKRLGQSAPETISAVTSFASTVGDMLTVLLIAPILRVAYLLRGGRLAWVWWAMAASGAVWLVFDAKEWIGALLPGDAAANVELLRATRSPGLALVGLAGFLQRDAVAQPAADGGGAHAAPSL